MTNVSPQHRRAALAALVTAGLLWGLTVPLSKVALGWIDPAWLAAVRFAIAAPVLALIARRGLRSAASLPLAAWGAVGYGGGRPLQNLGLERPGARHAPLIIA